MTVDGRITGYDGETLVIEASFPSVYLMGKRRIETCEIILNDGRTISTDQRKKIFATIRDISLWSGHDPEYLRQHLTWDFRSVDGRGPFSLSDTDVTTAREFLTYLINFCLEHDIPTRDSLLSRTDDLEAYLYDCLWHRKCAICGKPADLHHVETVGMGRDRRSITHLGMLAEALCREHHKEAHKIGQETFDQKYHIFGTKLDALLVARLQPNK